MKQKPAPITQEVFILHPARQGFLTGDRKQIQNPPLWGVIGLLIITTVLCITWVWLITLFYNTPQKSDVIVFIGMVFLLLVATPIPFIHILRRYRLKKRLERDGKIIQGQVTWSTETPSKYPDFILIHVQYSFHSPAKKKFEGAATCGRKDWKGQTLPRRGTHIAVIYVDDDLYTIV